MVIFNSKLLKYQRVSTCLMIWSSFFWVPTSIGRRRHLVSIAQPEDCRLILGVALVHFCLLQLVEKTFNFDGEHVMFHGEPTIKWCDLGLENHPEKTLMVSSDIFHILCRSGHEPGTLAFTFFWGWDRMFLHSSICPARNSSYH